MDFVSAAKKALLLYVTICEKVVPHLNKHDDVIEWNFMKIALPGNEELVASLGESVAMLSQVWKMHCCGRLWMLTCFMFSVIDRIKTKKQKTLCPFGHEAWKDRLVLTITASVNTIGGKWPKCLSEKDRCEQFALSEYVNQTTLIPASFHTVWKYVAC